VTTFANNKYTKQQQTKE